MAEVADALDTLLAAGHTLDEIEQAVKQMRQEQLMQELGRDAATAILRTLVRHSKRRRYAAGGGE